MENQTQAGPRASSRPTNARKERGHIWGTFVLFHWKGKVKTDMWATRPSTAYNVRVEP